MLSVRWVLVLLLFAAPALAAAPTSHKLAAEVARTAQLEGRVINVWWLPVEYWERVARELKWKDEDVRAIRESLSLYAVLAVLDASVGAERKFVFADHASIAERLELRVGASEPLEPLRKLDPVVVQKLPELAFPLRASLGPLAEGLRLLLVSNVEDDGKPRSSATAAALIRARYRTGKDAAQEFFWRTPLTSITAPRRDPSTGEPVEASWRFNPWTGDKLP